MFRTAALLLSIPMILLAVCGPATADPKPWIWGWWPSHFEKLDFEKRLMQDTRTDHNRQWDQIDWQAQDWIAQRKSGLALVERFYDVGIISNQYMKNDIPVLEVGPSFYNLGGFDKRRVVETVDEVYEITSSKTNGAFHIYDSETHEPIGFYSGTGLQFR